MDASNCPRFVSTARDHLSPAQCRKKKIFYWVRVIVLHTRPFQTHYCWLSARGTKTHNKVINLDLAQEFYDFFPFLRRHLFAVYTWRTYKKRINVTETMLAGNTHRIIRMLLTNCSKWHNGAESGRVNGWPGLSNGTNLSGYNCTYKFDSINKLRRESYIHLFTLGIRIRFLKFN